MLDQFCSKLIRCLALSWPKTGWNAMIKGSYLAISLVLAQQWAYMCIFYTTNLPKTKLLFSSPLLIDIWRIVLPNTTFMRSWPRGGLFSWVALTRGVGWVSVTNEAAVLELSVVKPQSGRDILMELTWEGYRCGKTLLNTCITSPTSLIFPIS